MITSHFKISNDGTGMNDSLAAADELAKSLALTKKESFQLRLLAEEMFNMVRAITGGFNALFWIEEKDRVFNLHLDAPKLALDYEKRQELLSVSTKGENTASRGIMEKIRDIVEAAAYNLNEGYNMQLQYGVGMFHYGALGIDDSAMSETIFAWSMQKYKAEIEAQKDEDEALDELEKSIIANIADDVRVGVRKDSLEIVIVKKF